MTTLCDDLTVCYGKWPQKQWVFPWNMVIFHGYVELLDSIPISDMTVNHRSIPIGFMMNSRVPGRKCYTQWDRRLSWKKSSLPRRAAVPPMNGCISIACGLHNIIPSKIRWHLHFMSLWYDSGFQSYTWFTYHSILHNTFHWQSH